MPDKIRFVAQMVFLLYVACAGVILAMNKVGHLTASIAHTKYTPDSGKNLLAWSARTKLLHGAVFVLAAVIAFWP